MYMLYRGKWYEIVAKQKKNEGSIHKGRSEIKMGMFEFETFKIASGCPWQQNGIFYFPSFPSCAVPE